MPHPDASSMNRRRPAALPMSIQQSVLQFIHRPEPGRFDALALAAFRYQFDAVPPYRAYCRDCGVNPETVRSLDDVPFVSTIAFKYAELAPPRAAATPGALTFFTSGTTVGRDRRGRHVIADPAIYRASALAHLRTMLFPDRARMRMLAMHPTADAMPESSLATMIGWCIEEFGADAPLCAADRRGTDTDRAIEFLARAAAEASPVCILGTTAAFAALFARIEERGGEIRLAPGSRMMDTGGAKGQAVPLEPREVAELAQARLKIAPDFVINEYGMTELCSQLYDATRFNSDCAAPAGERIKLGPPWLAPRAVDPVSMRRVPDGTPGMLAFFDLANVNSVSAVMTEDLGVVAGGRVRVLGRASAADARGCALALEAFASAARPSSAG
jgi:Acyl-protein synthetase, LuxE